MQIQDDDDDRHMLGIYVAASIRAALCVLYDNLSCRHEGDDNNEQKFDTVDKPQFVHDWAEGCQKLFQWNEATARFALIMMDSWIETEKRDLSRGLPCHPLVNRELLGAKTQNGGVAEPLNKPQRRRKNEKTSQ